MKIRTKILLTTISLIVLLGLMVIVASEVLVRPRFCQELERRGQTVLRSLSVPLTDPLLVGDAVAVQSLINETYSAEDEIVYIFVIDFDGRLVAHTFKEGFPDELLRSNPTPPNKQRSSQLLSTEEGSIRDVALRPLEGMKAEIHLGLDEEKVHAMGNRITNTIIGLTFLVVLLASGVVYFLSLLITGPLERLNAAVSKMSLISLDQRVDIQSRDEVGSLAQSFNEMAESLQTSYVAMGESESKYRILMKDANDAIFVCTLEGKILDVNFKAEKLTGFSGRELRDMTVHQLPPESEVKNVEQQLKKVDKTGTVHFESQILTKDKKVIDVDVSASRVRYGGHKVVQGIVRDITERKRMKDKLTCSEERYRTFVEHSGTAVALIAEDKTLLMVNKEFEKLSGLRREKIEGKMAFVDFLPEYERKRMISYHQQRRVDQKQVPTRYEFDFLRPDGKIRNIDLSVSVVPGTNQSIASLVDITERKQIEKMLRESEETAKVLLNAPTDFIALVDERGTILALNETMRKGLIGILERDKALRKKIGGPDKFIGSCMYDFFPPDIARFRKAQADKVFRTGKAIRFEEASSNTWFDTVVYPLFDKQGNVTRVAVIARDITERKEIGEEIRLERDKFQGMLTAIGDGVDIVTHDYRVVYANDNLKRIIGKDELIGHVCYEVFLDRNAPCKRCPMRRAIKSGRTETEEIVQPNGVIVELSSSPLKLPTGEMAAIEIAKDITKVKQAEDAVRESEEKHRALFETAKDAIFLTDETGKFVDVNQAACESLGYTKEELLRLSNKELDADPRGYETFKKVQDGVVDEITFEVNQRRKDGTLLPVEITGSFFTVGNRRMSLAIARDITERRRAEEKLKEEREAKEELAQKVLKAQEVERKRVAADIHDTLLQQMVAMSSWLNAIRADKPELKAKTEEKLERFSDVLQKTIRSGRLLVSELRPLLLETRGLAHAIRELVRKRCEEGGVEPRLEIKDLPKLKDNLQIAVFRVIQEAVINALKHAHPSKIRVGLSAAGGNLSVTVKDNGRGFNYEKVKSKGRMVAEHFGLAAMDERVAMFGGKLKIRSSIDKGTEVKAVFPLNKEK